MRYLLLVLLLTGCASTTPLANTTSTITITQEDNKEIIDFNHSDKEKMTFKRGDMEATYSSETQSLMSRIMSALTLGVMGAKK